MALFKPVTQNPMMNNQLLYFPQQQQQQMPIPTLTPEPQQQQQQQQQQTPQSTAAQNEQSLKIISKLDQLNDKLEHLRSITNVNNQNMPSMETSVLLQNIQRIVRENDQYKKEVYDKSNKIEELNAKITDLLIKSQNYVEQSHQMLEQKNFSFQSNAEKNVNKLLELEQDKMKLTGDLTKLTSRISELNLEINSLRKSELETKQHLTEVSKNTDQYKQTNERLLVENADLQTRFDTLVTEFKKERQLRKSIETKMSLGEEEANETKANVLNYQKVIEERKKKHEQDRVLFEAEISELKKAHTIELNELKEKLSRIRAQNAENQSEQMKQIEADLNKDWQVKIDKLILKLNEKHDKETNTLNEEKLGLAKQIAEAKEGVKMAKVNQVKTEAENESLKQKIEDLTVFKEKYERLQAQAVLMKERYEGRIRELLDAEPDAEVIGEQVKTVMNSVFKTLKTQLKPEQYYVGNGILTAMLKIIKMCTMQVLHSNDMEQQDQDVDYFSQHIYKTPEPIYIQVPVVNVPVVNVPVVNVPVVNVVNVPVVEEKLSVNETISDQTIKRISVDQVDENRDALQVKKEEIKVEIKPVLEEKVEIKVKEEESTDEDDGIQLINEEKETLDNETILTQAKSDEDLQNEIKNPVVHIDNQEEPEEQDIKNETSIYTNELVDDNQVRDDVNFLGFV